MFPSLAAILPFAVEELESGKAHLVMTSDDIWGGTAPLAADQTRIALPFPGTNQTLERA